MSRIQESIVELNKGFATAFIDHSLNSNLAYRPEFISNNYRQGRKVLVSIEEELARFESGLAARREAEAQRLAAEKAKLAAE